MTKPIRRTPEAVSRRSRPASAGLEPLEPRHYLSGDAVPFGADFRDGSAFMLGRVGVSVVLLESDGRIDAKSEQWSAGEIDTVRQEINEGLQWWEQTLQARFPGTPHELSFVVDWTHADQPAPTAYEPIGHTRSGDHYWINDFLQVAGADTPASHLTDMARYNHQQRIALDTHWAFTVFVVDSSNDADGRFSDHSFAYASYGGPYLVMTYDNDGWGPERMGQILAHETAHVFHALDEYASGDPYDRASGYLGTLNHNAASGHPRPAERTTTLMGQATWQSAAYDAHTTSPESLAMIGWQDSDGNGIFDVLDVPPALTGTGTYRPAGGLYEFRGHARAGTLPNADPAGTGHDMTINTIDRLQVRIDGGAWTDQVLDGAYDTDIHLHIPIATPGEHTIEVRTITDATGLVSNVVTDRFTAAASAVSARLPAPILGALTSPSAGPMPAADATTPATALGRVDAHSGATSFMDRDGTRVTFSLRGPGTATIDRNAHGDLDVTLDRTTLRTHLRIRSARGGDGNSNRNADLGSILVQHAIGSIQARGATLRGDLIVSGGLGRLRLGDVVGPSLIDVGNGGGHVDLTAAGIRLGDVNDLTLLSRAPITSLRATAWRDIDSIRDLLRAPTLGRLRVAGDFEPDLTLSGRRAAAASRQASAALGAARIGGDIRGATWSVGGEAGGSIGRLRAGGWLDEATLAADGSIGSLTLGGIRGSDVTAATIGQLRIADRTGRAASFVDARITAAHIGRVRLNRVATDNRGHTHGLTADTIAAYHRPGQREAVGPAGRFLDLSGDFAVRVV